MPWLQSLKTKHFLAAKKYYIFFPKFEYPKSNAFYLCPNGSEKDDTWLLWLLLSTRFQNGKIHGHLLASLWHRSALLHRNPEFLIFLSFFFFFKFHPCWKMPRFERQTQENQKFRIIRSKERKTSFPESTHMLGFSWIPTELFGHYCNIPKIWAKSPWKSLVNAVTPPHPPNSYFGYVAIMTK